MRLEADIKRAEKITKIIHSKQVEIELHKRYKECDSNPNNHVGPVIDNLCIYCYRHKTYDVDGHLKEQLETMRRERAKLSELDQPNDAPYWISKSRENIDAQKSSDRFKGLIMIAKEIYPDKFKH